MTKIMVLAGGHDQAAFIGELRRLISDVYIILLDRNPNVLAAKVADKMLTISTMDFNKVEQAAKDEKVDYIMTACGDQPLLTVGLISEKLGLPCYLTKEQILNLTNKKNMKKVMVDNDIPTSKYKTFTSKDEIDDSGLEYPLIVKPADSNGSKGVRKVYNRAELNEKAADAISYSISGTIIVEEFDEGEELSCDFYIQDGIAHEVLKLQSNKFKVDDNITSIIYQSIIPAPFLTETARQKLNDVANKIAKAYHLDNTPLLVQAIVKGDKVSVLEYSARLGGGSKYKTIQNVTGFNVLGACAESMLGRKPVIPEMENKGLCYTKCHFYTTGGKLCKIEGLDELMESGVIEEFLPTTPLGVTFKKPSSSGDRFGCIWISAKNYTELKEKILKAVNTIKALDENGVDILDRSMYLNQVDYSELI